MGEPQIDLQQIPISHSKPHFLENAHVPAIEAQDGILECISNEYAQSVLDEGYKYLASEKFFQSHALLTGTVSDDVEKSGYVISSKSYGRAIPLVYGEIPYDRMLGGVVVQKGGGISGKKIHLSENDITSNDPIGFYGKKDAQQEIETSNLLLKEGFRSSLCLGYAQLNPDWVLNQIKDPVLHARVEKSLTSIKEAGDVPVLLFRVDSTVERYTTTDDAAFSPLRFRADMARGARLLLREAKREVSLMQEYLLMAGDKKEKIVTVLNKLDTRQKLSEDEAITYHDLLVIISAKNMKCLKKFDEKSVPGITFIPSFDDISGKDLDLGHSQKDYERIDVGIVNDWGVGYREYMSTAGLRLFQSMKKSGVLSDFDPEMWNWFSDQIHEYI